MRWPVVALMLAVALAGRPGACAPLGAVPTGGGPAAGTAHPGQLARRTPSDHFSPANSDILPRVGALPPRLGARQLGSPLSPNIAGGSPVRNPAAYNAFLAVVLFDGAFYCGGALIAPNVLLTAGHCTFDGTASIAPSRLRVATHRTNLLYTTAQEGGNEYAVTQVLRNPRFEWDFYAGLYADVALLVLGRRTVSGGKRDAVVAYNTNPAVPAVGSRTTVAGYGSVDRGGPINAVLYELNMTVLANDVCDSAHGITVRESEICAGTPRTSTCSGDSGGPLLQRVNGTLTLVGAVSMGPSVCANQAVEYPNIFSRVSYVADWIRRVVAANAPRAPVATGTFLITARPGARPNYSGPARFGFSVSCTARGQPCTLAAAGAAFQATAPAGPGAAPSELASFARCPATGARTCLAVGSLRNGTRIVTSAACTTASTQRFAPVPWPGDAAGRYRLRTAAGLCVGAAGGGALVPVACNGTGALPFSFGSAGRAC
ncbi:trypsin-like cysteine/serine peptidase domain-containing protein [Hyaloraphidium curvatum]|nr:trypsin-like cysteine/serine peptidase domain-containing protein [Hyaloraphidium curvatum]